MDGDFAGAGSVDDTHAGDGEVKTFGSAGVEVAGTGASIEIEPEGFRRKGEAELKKDDAGDELEGDGGVGVG